MYICHINNIQTPNNPLPDLIHIPRGFIDASASSMSIFLHTQENPVNNTCRCKYNENNISPDPQYLIIIIQTENCIKKWITFTQVSSKNKSAQCAQEQDVTYNSSCFKLCPEVSHYISVEIKCITISYVQLSNKNGNC